MSTSALMSVSLRGVLAWDRARSANPQPSRARPGPRTGPARLVTRQIEDCRPGFCASIERPSPALLASRRAIVPAVRSHLRTRWLRGGSLRQSETRRQANDAVDALRLGDVSGIQAASGG